MEFRTLAAQSGFNDILKTIFQQSLNLELQSELACKGEDLSFSDFATLAIRIDNLMRQAPKRSNYKGVCYELRSPATSFPTTEPKSSSEPMQLGVSRLSDEERMRRRQLQLFFYCGEAGHRSVRCPHKSKNAQRVTY